MASIQNKSAHFGVVYKVTFKTSGMIYIGKTIQSLKKRLSQLVTSKNNRYIVAEVERYGRKDMIIEPMVLCDSLEDLNFMERMIIFLYGSTNRMIGHNIFSGGDNPSPPEESNIRRSASLQKFREENPFFQKGENNKLSGVPKSDSHKSNLSKAKRTEVRHRSNLSMTTANKIRELYSSGEYSQAGLARLFGIKPQIVYRIVHNLRWV